jgi:hypothetical protein
MRAFCFHFNKQLLLVPAKRSPTAQGHKPLMNKLLKEICVLLGVLLMLSGCSSPKHFEPQDPGKNDSLLYLYRPEAANPGLQPLRLSYPDIQLDGASIGQLKFNRRLAVLLKPGVHSIRVTGLSKKADWEPRDINLQFTVRPGEVKYLKLDVQYALDEMTIGDSSAKFSIYLTPVEPEQALYEIRNTRPTN